MRCAKCHPAPKSLGCQQNRSASFLRPCSLAIARQQACHSLRDTSNHTDTDVTEGAAASRPHGWFERTWGFGTSAPCLARRDWHAQYARLEKITLVPTWLIYEFQLKAATRGMLARHVPLVTIPYRRASCDRKASLYATDRKRRPSSMQQPGNLHGSQIHMQQLFLFAHASQAQDARYLRAALYGRAVYACVPRARSLSRLSSNVSTIPRTQTLDHVASLDRTSPGDAWFEWTMRCNHPGLYPAPSTWSSSCWWNSSRG